MAMSVLPLAAQTSGSNSGSTAGASAGAEAGANNSGIGSSNVRTGDTTFLQEAGEAPRIAPPVGAPSVNSTAPCVIGTSAGISVVGFGVSAGSGRLSEDCMVLEEAAVARGLAGDRAAFTHLCSNNERLRNTFVATGHCAYATNAQASRVATRSQAQPAAPAPQRVVYDKCEMKNGRIHVRAIRANLQAQAVAQCKQTLGF